MDKVLALECVIMGIMALGVIVTYIGYRRDQKRRKAEKAAQK